MGILFDAQITVGSRSQTVQGSTTTYEGFLSKTLDGATGTFGSTNDNDISTIVSTWDFLTGAYSKNTIASSTSSFAGEKSGGGDLSNGGWYSYIVNSTTKLRTDASYTNGGDGSRWFWSGNLYGLPGGTDAISINDASGDDIPDQPVWGQDSEVALDTFANSNIVTISGMDSGQTTVIFATVEKDGGTATGEFRKDGGSWTTIPVDGVAISGIQNNTTVEFRLKNDTVNTQSKIKAQISGVEDTFYTVNTIDEIAPTISGFTVASLESATEEVTVTLSDAGAGGTGLYYAQSTTTTLPAAGSWQTSATFNHPRGTTRYYWANRYDAGTESLPSGASNRLDAAVGYLDPVTAGYSFDATPDPQAYGAGNPAISFTSAKANHTVAIFEGTTLRSAAQTGATDYNAIGTNANVAAGGSRTYNLKTYRNEDGGGNPSNTYQGTDAGTTTVRKYPQTPSGLTTFTDGGTEAASGTFTIAVGGLDGASSTTITLSSDYTTNAVANGSAIASVARAGDIIYARNTGANGLTASAGIATPATYLAPDASISAITSPDQAYGSTTYAVPIANGYASDEYYVYNNAGTVSYGGRTGDGNITITHGVAAGAAATFRVYARKPVAVGGSNTFVNTGTTFEIEVYPQTPTATVTFNNPDDDDVTATITAGNGDGANTITYSVNGTDFSTDNTRPAVRGTSFTGYVRNTGVNGLTATASDTETPGFISPDLNISLGEGSAFTIGVSNTNFILTIQDGNSNDRYQVRDSSSTAHESRLGNGAITVTDLPAGGSETYTIFGKRPTGTGGTDTYSTTGTSVTVTQEEGAGIVPPVIQSVTNDNPNSSNVTATVNLTSPGSGGTLQYAQTTSNSVPSSGWQSGNTFSHPRNTTRYYWASQSTNTAGAYDSQSHFVANYTPDIYGIQIFNASGNLTLDISDRVSGIVSRGSFSVTTGTTNIGGQIPQYEGTSSAIAFQGMDPDNDEEFEVWISGDIPTAQFGLTNFTINRGTNSYTVTYRSYTASQTISVPYFNVRY